MADVNGYKEGIRVKRKHLKADSRKKRMTITPIQTKIISADAQVNQQNKYCVRRSYQRLFPLPQIAPE